MRVLFINTVYDQGSTGRIVADLGRMLETDGHEFKVAYGRGNHSSDSHCYRVGSDFDIYIHAGLSRITDKSGFYSKKATDRLIEFVKAYSPDIIHLHNLHGYYINIKILFDYLANEYKGRILWTLHDCWAFTGHCVHFTYAGCEKWKTECGDCPQKKEYPASYCIDNSACNYRIKKALFTKVENLEIITVSNWLRRMVEQSFLKEKGITCIYNGIDTEKFKPVPNKVKEELGISEKKLILLVSDGWNEQKGYHVVLNVANKAPCDWCFVMIGLSKKQIAELPKNIIGFTHIWNQEKLVEFYSAADVFFNPSIEETFGLVTGEALACGTPAVVMNSTACPEIIRYGESGETIETSAAIEDIVKAIERSVNYQGYAFSLSKSTFLDNYKRVYGLKE